MCSISKLFGVIMFLQQAFIFYQRRLIDSSLLNYILIIIMSIHAAIYRPIADGVMILQNAVGAWPTELSLNNLLNV